MARRKLPPALAKATGADVKNPQRYRNGKRGPSEVPAIGAPPVWMTPDQRQAWAAFTREMGWLKESDRCLLEIACTVRARVMKGEEVGVNAINLLRLCLGQLGGTPVDASKVLVTDDDDDPANVYFN